MASKNRKTTKDQARRGNSRPASRKGREPGQSAMAHAAQAERQAMRAGPEAMRSAGREMGERARQTQRATAEHMSRIADVAEIAATAPARIMHSWTQVWANWARTMTGI